jgi:DNA-binding response OmpR family regulator
MKDFILIVEDDRNTATLIKTLLEKAGFKTLVARCGEHALKIANTSNLSFVILDILLPKMDGWEVCRQLRRFTDVPIMILTACENEVDRVLGFSLGADDYVIKPFSPRELVERVKAILRRARPVFPTNKTLYYSGIVLDPEKIEASVNGKSVYLTSHEFKLLYAFMSFPGFVFSRTKLLEQIYDFGEKCVIDRVIDVHIGKLRQKIEQDPTNPQYIHTIRGYGYKLCKIEESNHEVNIP